MNVYRREDKHDFSIGKEGTSRGRLLFSILSSLLSFSTPLRKHAAVGVEESEGSISFSTHLPPPHPGQDKDRPLDRRPLRLQRLSCLSCLSFAHSCVFIVLLILPAEMSRSIIEVEFTYQPLKKTQRTSTSWASKTTSCLFSSLKD